MSKSFISAPGNAVGAPGVAGVTKVVNLCQLYGVQCELHGVGAPHMHLAAATPEATCRYCERGLLRAECDYDASLPPHLKQIIDPMDDEGYVHVTQTPGLGVAYDWDYISDNLID